MVAVVSRRWSYACRRCGWLSTSSTHVDQRVRGTRLLAAIPSPPVVDVNSRLDLVPKTAVSWTTRNDDSEIRAAVHRYVERLNAGDVSAWAQCALSESTAAAVTGRVVSGALGHRSSAVPASRSCNLRCRDLRTYLHESTAIATAHLVGTITHSDGRLVSVTGQTSWVHLRQDGEWKLAHIHWSPLNVDSSDLFA